MTEEVKISQEDLVKMLEEIAKSLEAISFYFTEKGNRINSSLNGMQIQGKSWADEDRDREEKWQKCMDEARQLTREAKVTQAQDKVTECNKILRPY